MLLIDTLRRLQLVNLVSSVGAYDRIYDGLFEHYLTLNFHDPKLTSVRRFSLSRRRLLYRSAWRALDRLCQQLVTLLRYE